MQINISYDSSVTPSNFTNYAADGFSSGAAEETAFENAITYVVNLFDNMFTNNVTVNVDVGWNEYDGRSITSGDLGENTDNKSFYGSGDVLNALSAHTNYTGNALTPWMIVNSAQAKAIGLPSANDSGVDGWMGFSKIYNWSFTPGATPTGGAYYFVGTAEHELSEIMGRVSTGDASIIDLYRYSAPGVRLGSGPNYFSTDNGNTNLGNWNTDSSAGDLADWSKAPGPNGNDAFNFASPNVVNGLTLSDVTLMRVLGWDTATSPNQIGDGVIGWVSGSLPSNNLTVLSGGILEVGPGGVASSAVVRSFGSMTVSAGGSASGTDIFASATMEVQNGGEAISSLVGDTAQLLIDSHAVASNTTIIEGGNETVFGFDFSTNVNGGAAGQGIQTVSAGGDAEQTQLNSDGFQFILGGVANFVQVESGGVQTVNLGGNAASTFVNNGGVQMVAGGNDIATTVSAGGRVYVGWDSPEGPAVGSASYNVIKGGEQDVLGYGSATSTTVSAGSEKVYSGGTDIDATIDAGASQSVYASGTAIGTQVYGGVTVSAQGTASTATIYSGGTMGVSAEGIASSTTVDSGGTLVVSADGAAYSTTVDSGGNLTLMGGAIYANGLTIDAGGTLQIEAGYSLNGFGPDNRTYFVVGSGGSADLTAVDGAWEIVEAQGVADDTSVNSGIQSIAPGGIASATQLYEAIQYDGGIASNTTVDGSGSFQQVDGIATSTTVQDGGAQYVDGGGLAIDTMIYASGSQTINGVARGTIINVGGQETVSSGGTATGTTVSSGGLEAVSSGGATSSATVNSGGMEIVWSGGTARGTTVCAGAKDFIGGIAIGAAVDGGGTESIGLNGEADSTTVSGVNAVQNVFSGGLTVDTTVDLGGQEVVLAGGGAGNTTVNVGGAMTILGTAYGANVAGGTNVVVSSGGLLDVIAGDVTQGVTAENGIVNVFSGGTANGAVVSSGGVDNVIGGTASGTAVNVGGLETVSSGGTVSGSTVSGGELDVDGGGVATGIIIDSGGTQNVSGGEAVGTTVNSSGLQDVVSGVAINTFVTATGVQFLTSGGGATGTMLEGGEQRVYDGAVASGTVIGNGGLQLVDGAFRSYLSSFYRASTATGSVVASGGTVQVAGRGVTIGTSIHAGSLEVVGAGGTAKSTIVGGRTMVVASGGLLIVSSGATASGATVYGGGTIEVFDGGLLAGSVLDDGTVNYDITGSAGFSGTLTGSGTLVVSGGGNLDVALAYTGAAQVDDASTLEFSGAYSGAAMFSGSSTGSGGTLKFDGSSVGPVEVVNPNDTVIAQPGSGVWINSLGNYTLPANVDTLFLYGGTQGAGNGDAGGNALYAVDAGIAQTLIGNSLNNSFVVYNSSDVVVPKAGSHDVVYAAASYTLPTGVDVLILEAGTQAVGNSDAAGDALYAANAGIVQTLIGNSANDTFVVYNSADAVVPKAGSHDLIYSAVNYTLPTGVNSLILEAGTQAVGNSDVAGDTLYAANPGIAQTLTGNSHNDTFVVYNSADTVIGQAGSTDTVYTAANLTLPTNVDTLFLEGPSAALGKGNGDAVDALFGNASVASTLVAGAGADTLYVTGAAGTIMTGGAGHDTFAFPNVMGKDEVTNFGLSKDTLQFNATLFSNFTAAMSAASQIGANTVFTIDTNDNVTLDNVSKTSLTAGNFHFI